MVTQGELTSSAFADIEARARKLVYPNLESMPKDMRRAQKISFVFSMAPRGMNLTKKQAEELVDHWEEYR